MSELKKSNVEDMIGLTPVQEGMLFHYLQNPNADHYHEQLCICLSGSIRVEWFQQAWQEVIDNNEMLRTVFRWEKVKQPVQIILKECKPKLEYYNISWETNGDQDRMINEVRKKDLQNKFDLRQVPFRVVIFQTSENRATLLISNHHILYDGWSNGIVIKEMLEAYARASRQEPTIKRSKPKFKAFIKRLQAQSTQDQKKFWSKHLIDVEAVDPLSLGKSDAHPNQQVEHEAITLSSDERQQLERLAAEHELTVASIYFSAWAILLQRYKNSDDAVFGTTVSGRPTELAGCEEMVGLFINTIPLRVCIDKNDSMLDVVKKTNEAMRERAAYEHTSIVDIQSTTNMNRASDLFDTVMVIENYPLDERLSKAEGPLVIDSYSAQEQTHYNLMLSLEMGNEIKVTASYDTGCYEKTAVERMLEHVKRVLLELVIAPNQVLGSLQIISVAERSQILEQFNNTTTHYCDNRTLHSWFEEQVEKTPHHLAVRSQEKQISYKELNERANQLAHFLITKGVASEDIIGIMMQRSIEMVIAILGILKAGAAYMPIDPDYPLNRKDYMLHDSGAKLLIVSDHTEFPTEWSGEIISLYAPELSSFHKNNTSYVISSQQLAYTIYTSGSTGKPKGVLITHRNVINLINWFAKEMNIDERSNIAFLTNYIFDPSVEEIFGSLLYGATLHCVSPEIVYHGERLLSFLGKWAIDMISLTPTMLRELLYEQKNTIGLKIIVGGEKLDENLKNQIIQNGFELYNSYGPTETTVDALTSKCALDENVVLGKPLDNVKVYILSQHGTLQPVGITGELCISGDGVGRGYLNRPELTEERFVPNPFHTGQMMFCTGDMARWLPDGNVEYLGRRDYQVKINGVRIELEELESHLRKHPHVKDAIVVQRESKQGDKYAAAYYVSSQPVLSTDSLNSFLRETLPQNMLPSVYVQLEKLPLTPGGKVDRAALPQSEETIQQQPKIYVKPEKEMEVAIASLWQEALERDRVGLNDNFFDLGGNSLKLIRVYGKLTALTDKEVTVADMFAYPTVRSLAYFLTEKDAAATERINETSIRSISNHGGTDIAVIGMAGRFPGAESIDQFWTNLQQGVESIPFYTEEQLEELGVASELIHNSAFVRTSGGVLQDRDQFDASFFGYSAKEAELMDPQMRVLHECVWEALEHAGYNSESYSGSIGLYAGSSDDYHWTRMITADDDLAVEQYRASLLSRKDFLCTNISYKLNLRGPSYTVQTGCSTSLVAIANACQAIRNGECNMAIAGGVSIYAEMAPGYVYEDGMIFSPDGHCRAFDANAQGTVPGEGVGVVVLKRLQEAIDDGDYIHAVVKGVGTNNDGYRKVGFTAPSIEGQAEAIKTAQRMAGIEPESITYIEAHGTATPLGDPVELAALKRAFPSEQTGYCAIGSVKTNIGHLDAAAGVAGFIKTVQALKHKQIPASLHFETPTSKFDFNHSPFYVNHTLTEWTDDKYPRRAGVSSFGIGGTNAHILLEEAPVATDRISSDELSIIPLSARSEEALQRMTVNLSTHITSHPDIPLADIAFTLQSGRKSFPYRKSVVCSSREEAVEQLSAVGVDIVAEDIPRVFFMFPGQGSQQVNMARELYEAEPVFREEMERCFVILNNLGAGDVQQILYPTLESGAADAMIVHTEYAQPAIFVVEYVLSRLLMTWGIHPYAMIGHSLGEYVAACLSGVLSLEDALRLVVIRGKLMQSMVPGAMVSVTLTREELLPLLHDGLSLAAVNAPSQCVVAGDYEDIARFEQQLTGEGYIVKRLNTSHAFHSKAMDPILEVFADELHKVRLNPPQIPYLSNVTGGWITVEEAVSPSYWVRHLRETVYFNEGLNLLLEMENSIFVEVGPGRALAALVSRRKHKEAKQTAIHVAANAVNLTIGRYELRQVLTKLWGLGAEVDWNGLTPEQKPFRVPLPTYPFERKRYWPKIKRSTAEQGTTASERMKLTKQADISNWFYTPSWERSVWPLESAEHNQTLANWLIFSDEQGMSEQLVKQLHIGGHTQIVLVKQGVTYSQLNEQTYVIDPTHASDYQTLFTELQVRNLVPDKIVHFWSMSNRHHQSLTTAWLDKAQDTGFFSCMYLAQTIGTMQITKPIRMVVMTSDMYDVNGEERLQPEQATVLGFVKICPLEYPNIHCQSIDLSSSLQLDPEWTKRVLIDAGLLSPEIMIAYRGAYRWTPVYKRILLEHTERTAMLREHGVYLVTGGLGGIGMELAKYVADYVPSKVVLLGRSPFPVRESWSEWLAVHGEEDTTSKKIRSIRKMEENGSEVMVVSADLADMNAMTEVMAKVERQFGKVNGVIHAAGVPDYEGVIQNRTREMSEKILAPKVKGTLILDALLEEHTLDFYVLCSSNGNMSYHYKFGQVAYNAANEFIDAYVSSKRAADTQVLAINWCDWKDVGMSVQAAAHWSKTLKTDTQSLLQDALSISEGREVFGRILSCGQKRIIVSPVDLHEEIAFEQVSFQRMFLQNSNEGVFQELDSSGYSHTEAHSVRHMLIAIWEDLLGKDDVTVDDNIFDLGANSLDIIQANSKLKAMMKRDIPIVTMYTYPTIHTLAEHLTQGEEQPAQQQVEKLNKDKSVLSKTLAKLKSHS
ncbi:hybrid non-ribosomal peptide synthetase/type I polyketide synthase [Paenibacillus arenosi]|uniref:Amino acid adenylation domain-containing protein n=1 Tax=Paenibacillus arenosi TaxID=2774142 RepID=A0ABR9AS42_9BACL|nr:non-ribosomal peptide synthetase/type I polyketide synthase [Paenibacillus arenosi]MBD8496923.1 amino acid adenylation domain-containing protein [Paenibacillus arenosi]